MKKLIVIFLILFVLTFLVYSAYRFVSVKISTFDWPEKFQWWNNFDNKNLSTNLYIFKDSYTATNLIKNIDIDAEGIKIKVSSYNGKYIKYDVIIQSNFDMKLKRSLDKDTLILKTQSNGFRNHGVKRAELNLQVPETMDVLNLNLTGGEFDLNSCNFKNFFASLTGGFLQVDNTNLSTSTIDLTGGVFRSNFLSSNSLKLDLTGCDVNLSNFKVNNLNMNLTGGKGTLSFSKYNLLTLSLTGGSVKFYGINPNIKVKADISVGYVDFFGKKYIKSFSKNGSNGDMNLDVSAAKVDFE